MVQYKRVKASDVIGNSYYIYKLTSSNYNPSLNGSITITCTVTNIYGQAVSGKSITLYQNTTSKGAKTTDSNGMQTWSITCSSGGLQTFRVEDGFVEVFVDNKAEVGHSHSGYLTSADLSDYVTTDDSRLSDARTPTSHTHTTSQISDFPSTMTPSSHTHGNLQNNGQVGSTAQANKNVVTDSSGKITTEDKPTIPSASSTTPSADTTSGSVGTGTTWARSNHTHPKSSLYAEATHNHTKSQITDFPTIPSKTSDLTNDSGFLTSHQSLSGYLQTSDVKDNLTSTDTNKPLSALQGKELKALIDNKEDNIEIFTGSVDRVNSTSAFLKAYTSSSILEGKIILYKVPNISSIEQTTNVALDYYANNQTTSFYRKYVYKNGVQLTFGDIESNSWILLAYDGTLTNGQWNLISSSSYAEASHTHSQYLTEHQDVSGKENTSNKVTSISSSSTDTQYPSAKCVYNQLAKKLDKEEDNFITVTNSNIWNYSDYHTKDRWSSEGLSGGGITSTTLKSGSHGNGYYSYNFPSNVTEVSMEISSSVPNCLIVLDTGRQIPISAIPTDPTTFTAISDDGFNIDIPDANVTVTYSIKSITFNMNTWIDKIYPIGAIYISMVGVAPSTLFGGEWTALEGRFLIGQDGTNYWNGATGGSATVALTKAQMPRHNHTQTQHRHTEHGNWSTGGGSSSGYMYSSNRAVGTQYTEYATPTINHTGGTGTTNADANGSPHENMPPYIGVYMWKRIG